MSLTRSTKPFVAPPRTLDTGPSRALTSETTDDGLRISVSLDVDGTPGRSC